MTRSAGYMKSILMLLGFVAILFTGSHALAETKTIVVATDSDTAPFTYKDGKTFKGYDIAVLKAVFKGSKDYRVRYETTAFASILTGLDAGRYQIAANNYNYNADRAKKYLFSEPISRSNYAIASRKGETYERLEDLSGKRTEVISGSNYAQFLENWNKENADKEPIDIRYVANTSGVTSRLQAIESEKIDFILYDGISLDYLIKDQGLALQNNALKDEIGEGTDGLEYFLFADDEEGKTLATFVNQRLKVLKKDGTLKKLSQSYFGGDFVSTLD